MEKKKIYLMRYNKEDSKYMFEKTMHEFFITEPFYSNITSKLEKGVKDVGTACVTLHRGKVSLFADSKYFDGHFYNLALAELGYKNHIRVNQQEYDELISKEDSEYEFLDDDIFCILDKKDLTPSEETNFKNIKSIWTKITDRVMSFKIETIKHEVLHIIFEHLFRGSSFPDREIANLAMDLVVNQYLNRENRYNDIFLDQFPELKLEPKRETEYYYKKLTLLKEKAEKQEKCDNGDSSDENNGYDADGIPNNASKTKSWSNLKSHLEKKSNHDYWSEFEKLSESEKQLKEHELREYIKEATNRNRGKLPSDLEQYLSDFLLEEPKINWKNYLKRFVQSTIKNTKKTSKHKRSRRTGSIPGSKNNRESVVLLAVDTSGSVLDEDLALIFSEIYHIYKTKKVVIEICECDAELKTYNNGKQTMLYNGKNEIEIHGRGGTDFNPPLNYFLKEKRFNGLIYFTDGYAPPPERNIGMNKILWVVTPSGNDEMKDFEGLVIKMEE